MLKARTDQKVVHTIIQSTPSELKCTGRIRTGLMIAILGGLALGVAGCKNNAQQQQSASLPVPSPSSPSASSPSTPSMPSPSSSPSSNRPSLPSASPSTGSPMPTISSSSPSAPSMPSSSSSTKSGDKSSTASKSKESGKNDGDQGIETTVSVATPGGLPVPVFQSGSPSLPGASIPSTPGLPAPGEAGPSGQSSSDSTASTMDTAQSSSSQSDNIDFSEATSGGGGGAASYEEQVAALDASLDGSMQDFDGMILDERTQSQNRANQGGSEDQLEEFDQTIAYYDEGDLSFDESPQEEMAGGPQSEAAPSAAGGGSPGGPGSANDSQYPVPDDIPSGDDDDVVARQIREAAMKEKDADLREKLWEEYRKYKEGTKR